MAKKLSDLPGTNGGRVGSFSAAMYEVTRFVNEIGRDFTPVYSQLYHIWKFHKTLLWRRRHFMPCEFQACERVRNG